MTGKKKPVWPVRVKYTKFGRTKLVVPAKWHNMNEGETPDEFLWVETHTDWYALMSPQLKNKKVVVITRNDWLEAEDVTTTSK